jgi:hypothetical protein
MCRCRKKGTTKGVCWRLRYDIVYGTTEAVAQVFENAVRCKTINTVYVESRNGKFRKDDARLIRRTLCHSKKSVFHDAQANFMAQVMNYSRTNDGLKLPINPSAAPFEQKYQHRTPAMAQKLIDKPLTMKELLLWRPQISP